MPVVAQEVAQMLMQPVKNTFMSYSKLEDVGAGESTLKCEVGDKDMVFKRLNP